MKKYFLKQINLIEIHVFNIFFSLLKICPFVPLEEIFYCIKYVIFQNFIQDFFFFLETSIIRFLQL